MSFDRVSLLMLLAVVGGCSCNSNSMLPHGTLYHGSPQNNDEYQYGSVLFWRDHDTDTFHTAFCEPSPTGDGPYIWTAEDRCVDLSRVTATSLPKDCPEVEVDPNFPRSMKVRGRCCSFEFESSGPDSLIHFAAIDSPDKRRNELPGAVSLRRDSPRIQIPCTTAELEAQLGKPDRIALSQ